MRHQAFFPRVRLVHPSRFPTCSAACRCVHVRVLDLLALLSEVAMGFTPLAFPCLDIVLLPLLLDDTLARMPRMEEIKRRDVRPRILWRLMMIATMTKMTWRSFKSVAPFKKTNTSHSNLGIGYSSLSLFFCYKGFRLGPLWTAPPPPFFANARITHCC